MQERESATKPTIILGALSLFYFSLWFSKGFRGMAINTDAMKEAVNMINFKFPQMLFSNTAMTGSGIWHRSRWSADVLSYLSLNVLSPIISFFTGDPISALYIGQGFYIALIFLGLIWTLSIYTASVLHIKIRSYFFVWVLLIAGFWAMMLGFPNIISKSILPTFLIVQSPPYLSNYLWTIVLVLCALLPYWGDLFHQHQWNNLISRNKYIKLGWYAFIIFAAFSSINASVIYGFCLLLFSMLITVKGRSFTLFWKRWGKDTSFALFLILTSIIAEGFGGRDGGVGILKNILSIKLYSGFIKPLGIYSLVFILLNIFPLVFIFLKYKKNNIFEAVFYYGIIMLAYLCFVTLFAGNAPTYYMCANIMLIASVILTWSGFFKYYSSLYTVSLFLFVVVSHFISYITYYPDKTHRDSSASYLRNIHQISKTTNIVSIGLKGIESQAQIDVWGEEFYFTIIKNFCYTTGIVDRNIEIELETKISNP